MATQRGYEVVAEFTDKISGTKARRPGLDAMMSDARRGRFDVVLIWACDRIARSTRHFLDVLDDLNRLPIPFGAISRVTPKRKHRASLFHSTHSSLWN
jgi:DNA invertase Pin-like site-specific DNA recombinase